MTYKTHLGKNNGKYMRSTTDIIHAGGGCCSDGIKQFCQCLQKLYIEVIVSNNFFVQ